MSEQTLRTYLRSYLDAQPDGDVTLAWQGGEPTMMGIDFYKLAIKIANKYARPTQRLTHAIQTNGTLIGPEWAAFFKRHDFLVGVSFDGPADIHDHFRVNKGGRGTHRQVLRGWRILQDHGVDLNVLCTLHAANEARPLDVYRHFRDDLGATFMQFIPIVERVEASDLDVAESGWRLEDRTRLLYRQAGDAVTSRSVTPGGFAAFLSTIWDEWVRRDVGRVFVQHFDVALGNRFGMYTLCVHAPRCGRALAIEPNGDVYSCDHYVEPDYLIGNVDAQSFPAMLATPAQVEFGTAKQSMLPSQCRTCPVRWACHGGCPKDRFATTEAGEPGLNYLCAGYKSFFSHVQPDIETMGSLVNQGRAAADIMATKN